jgi:hypothetical protein
MPKPQTPEDNDMRRILLMTVWAATSCAQPAPEPTAALKPVDHRAEWMAALCNAGESYETCHERVAQENLQAHQQAIADPAYQEELRQNTARWRMRQADQLDCQYQARAATVGLGNDGTLFYGSINQAFQANQLYDACMQARTARY